MILLRHVINIKVNLKDKLINFYEWESKDKITILKKVPIFKVNEISGSWCSLNNFCWTN